MNDEEKHSLNHEIKKRGIGKQIIFGTVIPEQFEKPLRELGQAFYRPSCGCGEGLIAEGNEIPKCPKCDTEGTKGNGKAMSR